jgi:hypothetical protein
MRRLILFAAALSLTACATAPSAPPATAGPSATPDRGDAILAVAGTAAAVADAMDVAPPASVTTRTTIDEKAIRIAFKTFDATLTVIDAFVATGQIVPGTPQALTLKRGVLATKDALNAASAAQRAGSATSYTAALVRAEQALTAVRSALAR